MATRRGFKKDMNLIYSDLLLEALDSFRASKNKDEKKISELCNKISDHHADFISRASHTDGKAIELMKQREQSQASLNSPSRYRRRPKVN